MAGVTIKDVAERAGLSVATVSRALSGRGHVSETARTLSAQAARDLGYVASYNAASLASGRSKNVGLVVPWVNRWFFSTIIETASTVLAAAGYDVTLYYLGGGKRERGLVFSDFLLRKRVDGLLAVALELDDTERVDLLRVGTPVVCIGGVIPGVSTVSVDDFATARLATDHLVALGHRRIAHIGWEGAGDFALAATREDGYARALRDAGLEVVPELVALGDFTMQEGYSTAKRLLSDPRLRPTAISAASDELAIGAITAARDLGLDVPRDVSVVGIDGHDLGGVFGLTTVDQHVREQATQAADLLLRQLDDDSVDREPVHTELGLDLVIRSSTMAPRPDGPRTR
ncbi:LacI family DNA-binding transcriptional regulator [Mumia sp.]|uniref:LacI family DNA-binding transcriptional regulator n=1 Tax=Mumia sp. TaxID=1965300 RepID=UPI00262BEB81|nr:LacI family DNA-binding transcriptional regulator [Mumia sp.]MDD9348705.1 LacI family DNA-binding transcriptional regulator [Mumia sp.]